MLKLEIVVFVVVSVIGLVCADCYLKEDFMCIPGSEETVNCYDCSCLGNGYASCCRKSSAMRPGGYPDTCVAIFKEKSCKWKIVEKENKKKRCFPSFMVG